MKSNWNYPTTIWVGKNRINDLSIACENLNIKKPLFVTDKDLIELQVIKNVLQEFSGKGFSEFKPKLTDLAVTVLEPINNEMSYLSKNTDYIDEILKKGSEKATLIAEKVLSEIKEIIGFINK